jgi:TPR repeat protein
MTSFSQPILSPLYFDGYRAPQAAHATIEEQVPELPAELISLCFAKFANWGDLAKLACVQKSWSNILVDATEHSPDSKWELANALLVGSCGLEKNAERSVNILKELAHVKIENEIPKKVKENGKCYTPALRLIAECYFEGAGVRKESKLGLAWLKAAFHLGNDVDAAHEIALTYEYGHHGVENDVIAAALWFKEAAEEGHIEAMSELGLCYELGCGVEQNDEEALDWYTKAANLGHIISKFSVGEAFEEARGVPQSDEEACMWYYRAALAGDEDSKKSLRRLYDIARIVVPGVTDLLHG